MPEIAGNSHYLIESSLQSIPIGLSWKSKNGFYLKCNNYLCNILGLKNPAEIQGKVDSDLVWKKHEKMIRDSDAIVLKSGNPIQTELAFINSHGERCTYLITSNIFNENNETGVISTYTNISAISKRENALKNEFDVQISSMVSLTKKITGQAEHKNKAIKDYALEILNFLNYIIACMPGNIYWMNENSTFLGCNNNVAKMLGLNSPSEIIGLTHAETARILNWSEGQAESFRRDDAEVIRTGLPKINIEEPPIEDANGNLLYFLTTRVPIFDESKKVIGVIGNSIDITDRKLAEIGERKALEKSAEANAAKAAAEEATKRAILIFSGMQSHDLRTPLATINGTTKMLGDDISNLISAYKMATQAGLDVPNISEGKLNYFEKIPKIILKCVESANKYIDDSLKSIKGASLGESMINKGELVHCNASLLLQRIEANYPYKEENLRNLVHINTSHFFHFMGNEIFFNRLLENLIKNAFEQIELKNHGEIFIECHKGDVFNTITVKDMAGGVTQDRINKLFNGIQSTKDGGTGIGLSSAKHIMNAMGGDISCHLVNQDCIEFILSFPKI